LDNLISQTAEYPLKIDPDLIHAAVYMPLPFECSTCDRRYFKQVPGKGKISQNRKTNQNIMLCNKMQL
jgi:hypothetical protein